MRTIFFITLLGGSDVIDDITLYPPVPCFDTYGETEWRHEEEEKDMLPERQFGMAGV